MYHVSTQDVDECIIIIITIIIIIIIIIIARIFFCPITSNLFTY